MSILESIGQSAEPTFKWLSRAGGVLAGVATLAFFAGDHWTTWSKVRDAEESNTGLFAVDDAPGEISRRLTGLEMALGREDAADGTTRTGLDSVVTQISDLSERVNILENTPDRVLSDENVQNIVSSMNIGVFKEIKTTISSTVQSPGGDYRCDPGFQMLGCGALIFPEGNSVCGHQIRTDTAGRQICTVNECTPANDILGNANWRVTLTCAN